MLLTRTALAKIITDYEAEIKGLKAKFDTVTKEKALEVEHAKALCKIDIDVCTKKASIADHSYREQIKLFSDGVARCETDKHGVLKSPMFNFIAGNLVTGLICVGANAVK